MSRTPSFADWIGGYNSRISSGDRREIENNAAVMAWFLRNSLGWSDAAAATFIGYAWTYTNCDSYRGFVSSGVYETGAVVGLGFMSQSTAQAAGVTSGAPGTQLFYLCNPQDPSKVWDSNATPYSFANWTATTPGAGALLSYADNFYYAWKGMQLYVVDADEWHQKFYTNVSWVYANIDNLKLIDEWPNTWLYFEMSKRKKGGGKLYL